MIPAVDVVDLRNPILSRPAFDPANTRHVDQEDASRNDARLAC